MKDCNFVTVKFSRLKNGEPIVQIDQMLLGDYADRTPSQLRSLSNLLREIAKDAEQWEGKTQTKKEYSLV